MEDLLLSLICKRATHTAGSPPPCGEGLGVGVRRHGVSVTNHANPPPQPSRTTKSDVSDLVRSIVIERGNTRRSIGGGSRLSLLLASFKFIGTRFRNLFLFLACGLFAALGVGDGSVVSAAVGSGLAAATGQVHA